MTEYLFVSADIIAHSDEPSLAVQTERVAAINDIVSKVLASAQNVGIVWASGGDGGHIAFPAGTADRLAVDLLITLREWSMKKAVPLRVSGNSGQAEALIGADGRIQLVGPGINLAGRLLPFANKSRIVVTASFCNQLGEGLPCGITFHDPQWIQPKSFPPQHVFLCSAEGRFASAWVGPPSISDRLSLQNALARNDALEIVYRARRLLELNPRDKGAISALRQMALRRLRLADSLVNDVFVDERFASDVISAGSLIERRAGDTICEYNDEGGTMFLILKGQLGVFFPAREVQAGLHKSDPAPIMKPGELAGEIAFVLRRRRTATLRCLDDTALLAFSYGELLKAYSTSNLKDQLEEALNQKILSRIVEHVWNTASFFPTSNDDAPWIPLLPPFSTLTEVPWKDVRVIKSGHPIFQSGSMCILVSGRVTVSDGSHRTLDGVDYPILFVDFPNDIDRYAAEYQLVEDIKLLTIRTEGLYRLEPPVYNDVVERVRKAVAVRGASDTQRADLSPTGNDIMKKKHLFISYCRENEAEVAQLRQDLIAAGEAAWWDGEILGGQDWKQQIRRAMRDSYAVILCLSKELSERVASGVYPEVADAITIYRQQGPGNIFLVPVRLSDCAIPDIEIDDTRTLDRLQCIDFFPTGNRAAGIQDLLKALRTSPNHP